MILENLLTFLENLPHDFVGGAVFHNGGRHTVALVVRPPCLQTACGGLPPPPNPHGGAEQDVLKHPKAAATPQHHNFTLSFKKVPRGSRKTIRISRRRVPYIAEK
jgi:hypothetical protein